MSRYIDADLIVYKTVAYPVFNFATGMVRTECLAGEYAKREDIEAILSADVQDVKHGRWTIRYEGAYKRAKCYCSVCGKSNGVSGRNQMRPYCPNCGAKIDGEENA